MYSLEIYPTELHFHQFAIFDAKCTATAAIVRARSIALVKSAEP